MLLLPQSNVVGLYNYNQVTVSGLPQLRQLIHMGGG